VTSSAVEMQRRAQEQGPRRRIKGCKVSSKVPHPATTHRNNPPVCDFTTHPSPISTMYSRVATFALAGLVALVIPANADNFANFFDGEPCTPRRFCNVADMLARRELQPERRDRCRHHEPWLPERGWARRASRSSVSSLLALTTACVERLHPQHRWDQRTVLPRQDERGHDLLVPVSGLRLYGDWLLRRSGPERSELPLHLGK
jgi:hypothetical protein